MKLRVSFSGSITAPPRSSVAGAVVVLLAVADLSLAAVAPEAAGRWPLAVMIVLTVLAASFRAVYAIHMTLLALIWVLWVDFASSFRYWPLDKLAPLAFYGLAVAFLAPLRHSVGWLRRGRLDPEVRLMTAAVILISGGALVAWVILGKPDLRHHLKAIHPMPLWVFPLAGIGFACSNAAMEEIIFRGVILEALDSAIGAGFWSIGVQAVSFAAFHYVAGFPNGVSGFLMVLAYGSMLGTVRRRSRGMLAPWAAHVAADMVIFAVLALIVV